MSSVTHLSSEFIEESRCQTDGALLRLAGDQREDLDVLPFRQADFEYCHEKAGSRIYILFTPCPRR